MTTATSTSSGADIWFLKGFKPLKKVFKSDGTTESYPLCKSFTSSQYFLPTNNEGLADLASLLEKEGLDGKAMLKGRLQRPIANESRAGLSVKESSRLLVLDLDKVPMSSSVTTFKQGVEEALSLLPKEFQETNYVAQATSSCFATQERLLCAHVYMWLDTPRSAAEITNLLTRLNFECKKIEPYIRLASAKLSLSFPIDICLAQASRIIYIAPPVFDPVSRDPFAGKESRVYATQHESKLQRLKLEESWYEDNEKVAALKRRKLKNLREEEGLPSLPPSVFKSIISKDIEHYGLENSQVVVRPGRMQISLARDLGHYVTYNVNNGDSNAYWTYKSQPDIMRNFKGEPSFSFAAANKEAYLAHLNMFCGKELTEEEQETMEELGFQPFAPTVFRDPITDKYKACMLDLTNAVYKGMNDCKSLEARQNYMQSHNGVLTNPIFDYVVKYDPQSDVKFGPPDSNGEYGYFNTFEESEYLELHGMGRNEDDEILEDQILKRLEITVPNILAILNSICVEDEECIVKFIQWLAYIFQERDKAQTAWLFQGVEGTGKGVLMEQILRPLFGSQNASQIKTDLLYDKFDDYHDGKLIMSVDEFALDGTLDNKIYSKLKSLITEKNNQGRNLGVGAAAARSYVNIMAFTNSAGAVPVSDSDRRWNVAPRQQSNLVSQLGGKQNVTTTIKAIPSELAAFADILSKTETSFETASTPIENEAKEELRSLSKGSAEAFVEMVQYCNVETMNAIADTEPSTMSGDTSMLFAIKTKVKKIITAIANLKNPDNMAVALPASLVRNMYAIQNRQNSVTMRAVLNMFNRKGILADRVTCPQTGETSQGFLVSITDEHVQQAKDVLEDIARNQREFTPAHDEPAPNIRPDQVDSREQSADRPVQEDQRSGESVGTDDT